MLPHLQDFKEIRLGYDSWNDEGIWIGIDHNRSERGVVLPKVNFIVYDSCRNERCIKMIKLPESVIKAVKERGITPKEEKEVLDDLEKNFIKMNERNKIHEEALSKDKEYQKMWHMLNNQLK
ncbi:MULTISPECIES: hypothetical protein [Bacillus cereus group]|uniref:hypothetical protein n=1 Tax=Bacillus cereus group TaxID=86661 RepID=UPI000AB5ED4F|nr:MULTISPECIES: hypothetical protein [Bacillus cereus group]